jgi:signal transduction histidine kinase
MWRRIEGFLSRLNRVQVLAVAVCGVLAFGILDYVSGPHMAFALFYLLPVAFAAWFASARIGVAVTVLASMVALLSDLAFPEARASLYPYWNAGIRAGVMVIVVALLNATKRSLDQQRQMVERERESVKRLEEVNSMKDTFLRAVSHDLRNPLTAVVSSAAILQQRDDVSPEQARTLVEAIVRGGRHITRLIDQLLDVERIKERAIDPDMVTSDVAGLVTGIVLEWSAIRGRHIVLGEVQHTVLPVDAVLLQRILENLLDNAAKYSPPEGHIWVRLFRTPGGGILAVDDEGPGVPPELRAMVFELFERGQQAPPRAGLGLGLYLVAKFSQMFGGRAWVESRPEGGSSFRVFLPESGSLVGIPGTPLEENLLAGP